MTPHADVSFSLCRYVGAKRIVTVGAAPDVVRSLASGVHANCRRRGGLVVSVDTDDCRLSRVERTLASTELNDYVLARHGDPRRALRDLDGRLDLLWLACDDAMAEDVLAILACAIHRSTCVIRRGVARSLRHAA